MNFSDDNLELMPFSRNGDKTERKQKMNRIFAQDSETYLYMMMAGVKTEYSQNITSKNGKMML